LVVEPPAIVPLVEPLLIEPPVPVVTLALPGLAMVPLLALLLMDPELSDVAAPLIPFTEPAVPDALEMVCLCEPNGSVALTPLLVLVSLLTDCANASPEVARNVHRMAVVNKRDMVISPEFC